MERGEQKSETSKQATTRTTKAAADRRQNNKILRQCPSSIAERPQHHAINCCPNCYAEQSHKDNIRSSAVGKQLKQMSNSLSLYSPAPPSLLLISRGLCFSIPLSSCLCTSDTTVQRLLIKSQSAIHLSKLPGCPVLNFYVAN